MLFNDIKNVIDKHYKKREEKLKKENEKLKKKIVEKDKTINEINEKYQE
jgi:prefoldin subunit 5